MKVVQAVYEHGILRPVQPLQLPEGETVHLVIYTRDHPSQSGSQPVPTSEEKAYFDRLNAAKTNAELFAVLGEAPSVSRTETYGLGRVMNTRRSPDVNEEGQG